MEGIPLQLVFGLLFLIVHLVRAAVRWGLYNGYGVRAVFRDCIEVFRRIAQTSGGQFRQTGRRRFIYVTANRKLEVDVSCQSVCRMKIRINQSFPYTATFLRFPAIVYAFIEAFLRSDQRVEQSRHLAYSSNSKTIQELKEKPGFVSLMNQLGDLGASVRFDNHGALLWKPVRREDLTMENMSRLLRLVEDFSAVCGKEVIEIPIQQVDSEKRCAYCKEVVNGEDSIRYCSYCGTPQHSDCYVLNGGCTTYGCSETLQAQRSYDSTPQQTQ